MDNSGPLLKKNNIAIFTNLNSGTNLNVLKKAIKSKLKTSLRVNNYQVINFADLTTEEVVLKKADGTNSENNMGRYFSFSNNRQIILFGYNDIPKISNLETDLVDNTNFSSKRYQIQQMNLIHLMILLLIMIILQVYLLML